MVLFILHDNVLNKCYIYVFLFIFNILIDRAVLLVIKMHPKLRDIYNRKTRKFR